MFVSMTVFVQSMIVRVGANTVMGVCVGLSSDGG